MTVFTVFLTTQSALRNKTWCLPRRSKYLLVEANCTESCVRLAAGVQHFTAFMCNSTNNIFIQRYFRNHTKSSYSLHIFNPWVTEPEIWDKVDELFHVIPFVKLQSITTW